VYQDKQIDIKDIDLKKTWLSFPYCGCDCGRQLNKTLTSFLELSIIGIVSFLRFLEIFNTRWRSLLDNYLKAWKNRKERAARTFHKSFGVSNRIACLHLLDNQWLIVHKEHLLHFWARRETNKYCKNNRVSNVWSNTHVFWLRKERDNNTFEVDSAAAGVDTSDWYCSMLTLSIQGVTVMARNQNKQAFSTTLHSES